MGVDYVLVRDREPLIGPAFHYRDPRTLAPYDELRKDPGEAYIYERTGIQFMPLNSLYQLVADVQRDRGWVEAADAILMIADWFHWLMTGRRTVEETNASTTQLYNPEKREWSRDLIERLRLPAKLFGTEVIRPGAVIGSMDSDIARHAGFQEHMPAVVACCTHDTGSAVVAVPATEGDDWAYLSSGTWSLIGVELSGPLLTEEAREANFTNEIGFGGTIRFLRNVIGLWLLQECRRQWSAAGAAYDYAELMDLAKEVQPFRSVIHADDPRFLPPGDMIGRIQSFCRETQQLEPQTPGELPAASSKAWRFCTQCDSMSSSV
jgi:rhamnulokinase